MGEVPLHGPELTGAPEGDGHSACSGLQSRHDWERKMHLVKRYGVLIAGCSGFERSHLCLVCAHCLVARNRVDHSSVPIQDTNQLRPNAKQRLCRARGVAVAQPVRSWATSHGRGSIKTQHAGVLLQAANQLKPNSKPLSIGVGSKCSILGL